MAPFIHRVRVGRSERGPMEIWDVIVIGAGPAALMAASTAQSEVRRP